MQFFLLIQEFDGYLNRMTAYLLGPCTRSEGEVGNEKVCNPKGRILVIMRST